MEEYEKLGHMHKVNNESALLNGSFYLPHYPILKASSLTTKLHVVFDASVKSSTGISLNDVLMYGPTVEEKYSNIWNYVSFFNGNAMFCFISRI